ncbi:glycosyltransferase family 2 protein [Candidatus Laterigemmans baculatus]|uniref:glycosyltransferase family 2 protein n=1 Tax=Candidatus Laterigemmans baculatus TaxID=2770505 RepID=UPI0013DB1BF1|nr:glycosyltransferase family 2 protein [Candidatus Laterigemmans baculatus]
MTAEWTFWIAAAAIAYTYAGFPLLVLLRGWLLPRPIAAKDPLACGNADPADSIPSVSLIIAAHNEAESLGAKLENVLGLDYPRERLEVWIASDGSTDRTEAIAESYAGRGVQLLALPRLGKARTLNAAVAVARGEVLVFSDANSMLEARALRQLVAPFADPGVGGVAGDQRYLPSRGDADGCGERSYWSLDRWLKRAESRGGHAVSATGAIYAIRRKLFEEIPEGVTDDFVTSTGVIEQGYRLVFAEEAVAWEPVAESQQSEFARKVRVITRGLRSLLRRRSLLNPWRYGFYSLQLFSHKLLRRVMFVPLLGLWCGSLLLWEQGPWYQAAAVLQTLFYLLAVAGAVAAVGRRRAGKLLTVPAYFCMVNLACLIAWWRLARGQSVVLWEPQRPASVATSRSEAP